MPSDKKGLIEKLADIEHQRWAHWQSYVHEKGTRTPDGGLYIPPDLFERWQRQIDTEYQNLTESEKESDRDQVRKYLPFIEEFYSK